MTLAKLITAPNGSRPAIADSLSAEAADLQRRIARWLVDVALAPRPAQMDEGRYGIQSASARCSRAHELDLAADLIDRERSLSHCRSPQSDFTSACQQIAP